MTTLAEKITVVGRFAKSANLERDITRIEPLDGYVLTARALDVVERIAKAAALGAAGGAWSITGPYGSGKSSLALVLDAALGEPSPARKVAWGLIDEASPAVSELLQEAHRRHDTYGRGFHRALVTANREPMSHTVLRALHSAVLRRFGRIPPISAFAASHTLRDALSDAAQGDSRRTGPSPAALIEIARCIAEDAPLLLIIDEFGKNLEAIRDGNEADPYLLQQLAEAGQGSGAPIFTLTLQHLSFEDYLVGTDGPQRREWAKVQGRFEDVAYVESATQTRALIGTVFQMTEEGLRARVASWAQAQTEAMRALGIDLGDPALVASCYPLHPLAAVVLPDLCSRYGQHERTLFSFLTGPDAASAASFLAATQLPATGPLPALGLDAIYDYFVAGRALASIAGGQASRWTEVATRIRDTHGLSVHQAKLAKAVAVLNLVSIAGTVRASRPVLALVNDTVDKTLNELQTVGVVTYRGFADEYRIWHGTDVDIRQHLDAAHQRVSREPLVDILSAVNQPEPVVAARHSAEHDMLRVFSRCYVEGTNPVESPDAFSPYDGAVMLVVGSGRSTPPLSRSDAAAKPVVIAIPHDVLALDEAAREVAAVSVVLDEPAVAEDWVARRELGERLAHARLSLEHATIATFSPDACRWILLGADGETELPAGRGSAALSVAADIAYPSTPSVRNEMLNRSDVTSQGAKARRRLLEGMIEHMGEPDFGFDGYGPEVAMYRAVLAHTGIHTKDTRNDSMVFRRPTDPSLQPAWDIVEAEFKRAKSRRVNLNDVYAALLSPPIGMKAAVIPVLLTAGLLTHSDEIAIYEHGTFKPILTTDLSERMVRNPGHFDIKHFANTSGARRQVVDALAERLEVRPGFRRHRVANVLSIVGHLVSKVRQLDNYTRRTQSLKPATLQVRDALGAAVEPDELLFVTLPTALGLPAVPGDAKTYRGATAYAEAVGGVIEELTGRYEELLCELFDDLLVASAETSRIAITGQAAALENEVLDPAVRAFVLTLANDSVDTNTDWIKAVATVVARKAPAEWTDEERERFRRELPQQLAAFQRLIALHAEQRINGGGPFDAFRVTVTRSDGSEHVRLVGVDHSQRATLERTLDATLESLAEITGSTSRASHSLLALLSERLLPDRVTSDDDTLIDLSEARNQHG